MSDPKGKSRSNSHRGDSKKRNDKKSDGAPDQNKSVGKKFGDVVAELDGVKGELKAAASEVETLAKQLKEASAKVEVMEKLSENALKLEGLQLDLWIGDPVNVWNWDLFLILAAALAWAILAAAGFGREGTVGFLGVLFIYAWPCCEIREDSLLRRRFKWTMPSLCKWIVKSSPGSRHLTFLKFLDERHGDLRHDKNAVMKLLHPDAVYALVRVEDLEAGDSDEWTVSLELLAQLLAPDYHKPTDSLDTIHERIMRDAARFSTVNISHYYRWTEHIYIATAFVAYAHSVHLRERNMGNFVLAPQSHTV